MERCIICPVCGRIHDIYDDKPTMLLCRGCGSLLAVNEIHENKLPRLLDDREVEDFFASSDVHMQTRISNGIGVPMIGGKDANLYCNNRFYYVVENMPMSRVVAYLYRNGWNAAHLTFGDLLERIHDICPANQVEVDIGALRNRIGSVRWGGLKETYPNLELWKKASGLYPVRGN